MTFLKAVLAGSLWFACLHAAWAQVLPSHLTETQACDMLASDPLDQERPAYAGGIPARINNPEDAIGVCRAAAAQNPDNVRLRHNLGRAYAQNGTHDAAFAIFSEAAKADYPASLLALAEYLLVGPTPAHRAEGRDWLKKARDRGYPAANHALAREFEEGRGGPRDLAAAREEYAIAAEGGYVSALVELGRMYGLGLGGPQDAVKAREYYGRPADRGDAVAMNNLGHMLWRGEGGAAQPDEARKLIERAATAGFAPALNNLAIMLWKGVGGSRDPAAALKAFEAATSRYPPAWENMAALHLSGDLGAPNVDRAVQAHLSAAKAGIGLAPYLSSWLASTERKQGMSFACMLIALTIYDEETGSQIVDGIADRSDPFLTELRKAVGMIGSTELLPELQRSNTLAGLVKSPAQ